MRVRVRVRVERVERVEGLRDWGLDTRICEGKIQIEPGSFVSSRRELCREGEDFSNYERGGKTSLLPPPFSLFIRRRDRYFCEILATAFPSRGKNRRLKKKKKKKKPDLQS